MLVVVFFLAMCFSFFCYLGSYVTLQIVENEGKVRNLMNHPEEEHRYFTMFHHVSYVGGEKHEKKHLFLRNNYQIERNTYQKNKKTTTKT